MSTNQIIAVLTRPLIPVVGVMFILVGIYSLTFNIADAKYKNHKRSEKAARIGGWFYIISGTAIILRNLF